MTEAQRAEVRELHHFAGYAFEPAFWGLDSKGRRDWLQEWFASMVGVAKACHFYHVSPADAEIDLLVWSALAVESDVTAADFFDRCGRTISSHRRMIQPVRMLWGFSGQSTYIKARSTQEIDAFESPRRRYLVVYPFVKTSDWYLMGREARQGMMNEHIRLGKQYGEIQQLLLYSFGLQDQEFVVVYEMDDLLRFSGLVHELRSTEARRHTVRDTPLQTAFFRTPEELVDLWSAA